MKRVPNHQSRPLDNDNESHTNACSTLHPHSLEVKVTGTGLHAQFPGLFPLAARMARSEEADGERRIRRRRRSYNELEAERLYKSRGEEKITLEPDVSEVRRIRVERLEGSTSTRRSVATPKMISESHATLPSLKSASSHRRRHASRRSSVSTKHRTKRKSTSRDDSTPTYVYANSTDKTQSSRITISESTKLSRDGGSIDSEEDEKEDDASTHSKQVTEKPKTRKIRVIYVDGDDLKSLKPRERRVKSKERQDRSSDSHETVRRNKVHTTCRKSIREDRPASLPSRYVQDKYGFHAC